MKTQKVEIRICMGTTCFVMCNADLQELENEIDSSLLPYLDISGSACLGLCKDSNYHKSPCATINGKMIENVNKLKILTSIVEEVAERFPVVIKNGK